MPRSFNDKIKSFLLMGMEIAGPAAGNAFGFLVGGIEGAALGGASGVVITRSLSDFVNRTLSAREKARVAATTIFAIEKIKSRLEAGDTLRNDGFFEEKQDGKSEADEIFEGVLLKAKNEHEEKKAKIIGNIFANSAFSSSISIGQANHALRIAEGLTYRQMCLLSLITVTEGIELSDEDYGKRKKIPYETISLLQETYDLYSNYGLIILNDPNIILVQNWRGMSPKKFQLSPLGERYYQLMGIEESIPDEDIKDIARHFQLSPE